MCARVLLATLLAGTAIAAQKAADDTVVTAPSPGLESFSVASYGPESWLIVDVQPVRPSGSKVRFIQIHRGCGSFRVHETDHIFESVSVQQLARNADLCASDPTVAGIINLFKRKDADLSRGTVQGIEVQCGTEKVVHHLPAPDTVRLAALQDKAPGLAALWSLSGDIRQLYAKETGRSIPFGGHGEDWKQPGLEAQELAEQAAIEIHNGAFDLAVPVPDLADWAQGRSKISELVPEFREATALEENFGVVENLDHLGVEKLTKIPYPMMAIIAHIDGGVSLELSIDPESGLVSGVRADSGHPILQWGAVEAVKQWVFIHPYSGPNPLHVDIHFEMHCPPTVEVSYTTIY